MPIKTTIKYHLIPNKMATTKNPNIIVGKDVKKLEPLNLGCGTVTWYSSYGKYCTGPLQNKK